MEWYLDLPFLVVVVCALTVAVVLMLIRYLSHEITEVDYLDKNSVLKRKATENVAFLSFKVRGKLVTILKRFSVLKIGQDAINSLGENVTAPRLDARQLETILNDKTKAAGITSEIHAPPALMTQTLPPKRVFFARAGCGHVLDLSEIKDELFEIERDPKLDKILVSVVNEADLSEVNDSTILGVLKHIGRRYFDLIVGGIGGAGIMALILMLTKLV